MKFVSKLLFLSILVLVIGSFALPAKAVFPTGWQRKAVLTIDKTKVPATQTNFPVLIGYNAVSTEQNLPSEILDTTNTNKAKSDGSDLRFSSDSAGATQLAFEIVKFTQSATDSSRKAEIWVKIPSLSSTADTTIYVWYKNSTATALSASDTYGSQAVWSNSYAGVWHYNNSVNDSSASAANLTNSGTTNTTGKVGYGRQFTSASSNYAYVSNANLNNVSKVTFDLWLNPATLTVNDRILRKQGKFSLNYNYHVPNPNGLEFYAVWSGATAGWWFPAISTSTWTHVVFSYDGTSTSNVPLVYYNGVLQTASVFTSPSGLITSEGSTNLWVGTTDGTQQFYNGAMDDLRFSNTNRSADWITAEYNNQSAPETFWKTTGTPASTTATTLKAKNQNTSASWLSGWTYRKKITISNAKVSSDLTNFPLLVKLNADTLVGAKARSDGYDVRFTSSDGTTVLNYERETFTVASSKATAVFWVKVPTIATATNTTIYIYYGNASATTDWTTTAGASPDATNCASPITPAQCTWKEGASQNYKGIWHLNANSNDSTQGVFNGTNSNVTFSVGNGKAGQGAGYSGASNSYTEATLGASLPLLATPRTMSVWFKTSDATARHRSFMAYGTAAAGKPIYMLDVNASNKLYTETGSGSNAITSSRVVNDGIWHFAGLTYTGSVLAMYLDGQLVNSVNDNALATASSNLGIGEMIWDKSLNFIGAVDEVRVSSTARSADWIKFEYYNQASTNNQITLGVQEQTTASTVKAKGNNSAVSWLAGWSYRKKITISNAKVSSDLANFPLLVKLNSDTLVGAKALSTGYDIRFTNNDGTTLLSYERETFAVASSKATAVFWVKVPTITTATNTTIYIYYGNSSATTDWTTTAGASPDATNCASPITPAQCTWKEGASQSYAGVWHLPNGTTLSAVDSTATANNGTNNGTTATTGKVDGAGSFNGSSYYINIGNKAAFRLQSATTFSTWFSTSSSAGNKQLIGNYLHATGSIYKGYTVYIGSNGYPYIWLRNGVLNYVQYYVNGLSLKDGLWHQIALYYPANGSVPTFYVDGVARTLTELTALSGTPLSGLSDSTEDVCIGRSTFTDASKIYYYFNGSIDETRVASTVRIADWIKFEYFNMASTNNQITMNVQEQTTASTLKSTVR